jgi:SAM-dependent methyltransferase
MPGLPTEPVLCCPACGCDASFAALRRPDAQVAGGILNLCRCRDCSMVFLNPRLTAASVLELEGQSTVYDLGADQLVERIELLRRMVADLARFSPKLGRLLDVGCNRGFLLEAARRNGWDVTGVELSPVAAARARDDWGLRVYGSLDDLAGAKPFDLIVAWHVLEHTTEPVPFLQKAAELLGIGGVLAVQVPSFDFAEEFERRSMSSSLLCAVHNLYFTEETIRATVERAGLRPVWVSNSAADLMLTVICSRGLPT